jgi:hypothetical protein
VELSRATKSPCLIMFKVISINRASHRMCAVHYLIENKIYQ